LVIILQFQYFGYLVAPIPFSKQLLVSAVKEMTLELWLASVRLRK